MRETRKKMLGFSGLLFVAGMTFVATNIHTPGALAQTSTTDRIVVTVVNKNPSVSITSPTGEVEYTTPEGHTLTYAYSGATEVSVTYTYTNPQGEIVFRDRVLEQLTNLDYQAGSKTVNLNLSAGYGTYTYTAKGIGFEGVQTSSDSLIVKYVKSSTPEDDQPGGEDGKDEVDPDGEFSDSDIQIDISGAVSNFPDNTEYYQVEVYNPDGTGPIYTVTIPAGTTDFILPLDDLTPPQGGNNYIIKVTAQDENGNTIVDGNNQPISETIPMDPDQVADPQSPTRNSDGSVTVDLGVDPNLVDEAVITIADPNNPEIIYTVTIPLDATPDADGNITATVVSNQPGATPKTIKIPAPTIERNPGDGKDHVIVTLPFNQLDGMKLKEGGEYKMTITTKLDGKVLFTTSTIFTYPYLSVAPAGTPDTGRFFEGLNISREDYMITGLIVFFILSVVAIGIVARKRHATTKSYKRRK